MAKYLSGPEATAKRLAKEAMLASLAGDLWNELENLRKFWEGTEHESRVQGFIDDYERLAL